MEKLQTSDLSSSYPSLKGFHEELHYMMQWRRCQLREFDKPSYLQLRREYNYQIWTEHVYPWKELIGYFSRNASDVINL